MEQRAKDEIAQGNGGDIGRTYLEKKNRVEMLKQQGAAASYRCKTGHEAIALAEQEANTYLNDTGMKQYMTEASTRTGNFAGPNEDKTFSNLRATAEQAGTTVGETLGTDGGSIHGTFGAQKGTIGSLERSIYTEEQEIATHDSNIKAQNERMQQVAARESVAKANQNGIK